MTESGTERSIQYTYELLGLCDEETKRKIMKYLSSSIKHGSKSNFESCANTKAKQINVTKSSKSEKV